MVVAREGRAVIERRQLVLGAALVATLAATAWVATRPEEEAVATVAAPARRAPAAASTAAASAPVVDGRQPWAEAPASQLAAWQPPPPPPPPPAPPPTAAAPPPPPVAPPAPYQMIGRVVEGDGSAAIQVALLTGPDKALSARRGDVIDGQWRVEQVSDSGVRLTWLPGQLPQNIVFRPVP